MDERHVHDQASARRPQEVLAVGQMRPDGFQMVGWREHEILVAKGHYRCPHCRRTDMAEMSGADISRR